MALKDAWMERPKEISEGLTDRTAELIGNDFKYKVRYVFNGLRVWFVPNQTFDEGFTRPFAEEPCPKDKWYSLSDLMAYTIPTLPDDQIREEPRIISGPGRYLQERYPDPEVQGGRIALISFKHLRVKSHRTFWT
jgi:hypothetical protein